VAEWYGGTAPETAYGVSNGHVTDDVT